MKPVQNMLLERGTYFSNWSWRPSKLFDGNKSANLSLSIIISTNDHKNFVSTYNRWHAETRAYIFNKLSYTHCPNNMNNDIIPKIGSDVENGVYEHMLQMENVGTQVSATSTKYKMYYKRTGGLYWKIFTTFRPELFLDGKQTYSSKEEDLCFENIVKLNSAMCHFWSDYYWWWYQINSDVRNNNPSDLISLPVAKKAFENEEFVRLSQELQEDLKTNSIWSERKFAGSVSRYKSFIPKLSKHIINRIDVVLNRFYGFTEEELDFIINYDIKYRMGDELNDE